MLQLLSNATSAVSAVSTAVIVSCSVAEKYPWRSSGPELRVGVSKFPFLPSEPC